MELHLWLSLVTICILGAMSPGPSLALVVKNTLKGGTKQGYATAISHGIGVGIYAAITAMGIGVVIVNSPILYAIIQYSGAAFLLYLGIKSLISAKEERAKLAQKNEDASSKEKTEIGANEIFTASNENLTRLNNSNINGWRDGFLIAFLNPKLAIFFLALFSQFIDVNAHWSQNLIMAITVGVIDTAWYLLVTYGISRGTMMAKLKDNSHLVDGVAGVFLVLLATRVMVG